MHMKINKSTEFTYFYSELKKNIIMVIINLKKYFHHVNKSKAEAFLYTLKLN